MESEKETKMSTKRAKTWLLTYPQAEGITKEEIAEKIRERGTIHELVIGEEKHKDEGIHFHVYAKFEEQIWWNTKKEPRAWDVKKKHPNVQTVRNRRKTIEYVTKEDPNPYVQGVDLEAVRKKKRSYKEAANMSIEELFDTFGPVQFQRAVGGVQAYKLMRGEARQTEDVRGIWLRGTPGSGKSHLVETTFPEAYRKPQNKWWDGYEGQEVVILEDLDGPFLNHYLKIWADKWKATGEIKGGTIPLQHKWFIVTSNYSIRDIVEMGAKGDRVDFVLAEAIERRFKEIILMDESEREKAKEELREIIAEREEEEESPKEPTSKRSP